MHYVTEENETPLLRCCTLSNAEAEKCIKYLMKRGVDTNFQVKYVWEILCSRSAELPPPPFLPSPFPPSFPFLPSNLEQRVDSKF